MSHRWIRPKTYIALSYAASAMLVLVYVNMFPLWKLLSSRWGREVFVIVPILLGVGIIATVYMLFYRRPNSARLSVGKGGLAIGTFLCLTALVIPDPQFPVKRIHVAEYMLLSLVVRFAMSFRLQGMPLLFFSACFTSVLGVHDELLQGLHPSRTYGLRDLTVNTLASYGGALIWHALQLFSGTTSSYGKQAATLKNNSFMYLVWLITTVLAFVLPLAMYRGSVIPYWPVLPLIGAIVYFSLYKDQFAISWKHGIGALSAVSFALILYPVVNSVKALLFF